MIVFDGYITGAAMRQYIKKGFIFAFGLSLFATIMLIPLIIVVANAISNWIWIYVPFFLSMPLVMYFTKSKKDRLALTPRKIYIEDEKIVCIADKYEEIKSIRDVKRVYDHEEFYDLTFPFGKASEKFICQKSLISEGSLEEFEALFAGKIVKRQTKTN